MASNDHAALAGLGRNRTFGKFALQRSSGTVARGKIKIGDHKILDELHCAFHDRPVLASDHRVTVEDQFVLTTDEIDIGKRAARLLGSPSDQVAAYVVLVPLVRAGVDHCQQARASLGSGGHRPAVLPEVLTDGKGNIDSADTQHVEFVAGLEIAELVEHPVVGQVMLRVGTHHPTLVQDSGDVLWVPGLGMVGFVGTVQVPDDGDKITKPRVEQPGGESSDRGPGRLDEAAAQSKILDRIAGEHHLGKQHQMRAGVDRLL